MKLTIKYIFHLLLVFFSAFSAQAASQQPCFYTDQRPSIQPPRKEGEKRFNPKKFRKDLSDFITREAGLTAAESKAFMPVFFEMKEKQREAEHQKARTITNATVSNMSNKDCKRILSQISEYSKKSQRIETQYFQRLERIVGARKLVKAINADRMFGRRIFKQMTRKE